MRYFWAFVLIVLGVAGFGASSGWWDWSILSELIMYWPLILVFWGISLLFKKSKYFALIMFFSLLAASFLVYDISFSKDSLTGIRPNKCCAKAEEYKVASSLKPEKEEVSYVIKTGAMDLNITGGTDELFEGVLISNLVKPETKITEVGKKVDAEISTTNLGHKELRFFWEELKNSFNLRLNEIIATVLEIDTGASSVDLNLRTINLKRLIVKAGASDIKVSLGNKRQEKTELAIDAGASSIAIEVPKESGVRIVSDSGLTSINADGTSKVSDNEYKSADYDASKQKIEIFLKAGASSFILKRY